MRLSDVVAASGLAIFAEVALVIFLFAFVVVVVRLWWPASRAELEAQRMLPLLPETPDTPETPAEPREGAAR